ncbi:MAG: hypothetical protein HC911_14390 [Chloroflexaceae bacterium]|nr:hypothetical protein [Chloroflexaceae bacterium]
MESAPHLLLNLSFSYTVFLGLSLMLLVVACNLQISTQHQCYVREFYLFPTRKILRLEMSVNDVVQFRFALAPMPIVCP